MLRRYGILLVGLVVLMALAVPSVAGPNGTDRPFKGDASGFALYGSDQDGGGTNGLLNVLECDEAAPENYPPGFELPPGEEEMFREFFRVTTFTSVDGTASHLGKVHMEFAHCPNPWLGPIDGQIGLVAANGDVLYGEYEGMPEDGILIHFKPQSTLDRPCPLLNDVPCESTGRFAGASGMAVLYADVMPGSEDDLFLPWPWWGEWTGSLSY